MVSGIKCKDCGGENPENSVFCSFCGKPLWTTCPKCESENLKNSLFCNKCGAELKKSNVKHVKIRVLYSKIRNSIGGGGWRKQVIPVLALLISLSAVTFTLWYNLYPGDVVYSASPDRVYMQTTGTNAYNVVVPVTWENTGGRSIVVSHIHLLVYDGGNMTALNTSTYESIVSKSTYAYSFKLLGTYNDLSTETTKKEPSMDANFIIQPHNAQIIYLIFEPPKNFTYTQGHNYYFIVTCKNNNNLFAGDPFNITNFEITSNPPVGKIIPYRTG